MKEWFMSKPMKTRIILGAVAVIVVLAVLNQIFG